MKAAAPGGLKNFARRLIYRGLFKRIYRPVVNEMYLYRESVADMYIRGAMRGIEIGALDRPMRLAVSEKTSYVDRLPAADLLREYPEKKGAGIVGTDIIDDGETLASIGDGTLDYVVANHFLEHCRNPILALENMGRKLRSGGVLFLTVPDKRHIFDSERPETEFAHVAKDYAEGPGWSDRGHYEEWALLVMKTEAAEVESRASEMMRKRESIHFHVWTRAGFLEFVLGARKACGLNFEIEHFSGNGYEVVAVLRIE